MLKDIFTKIGSVDRLSALVKWTPGAPENVQDIAIDLGTATGIIYSGGEFGRFPVIRPDGTEMSLTHIRTIVAKKRPKQCDLDTATERRQKIDRIKKEQSQAISSKYIEPKNNNIEVVGQEAFQRWGRNPDNDFIRAVRQGNIGDPDAYLALLRHLIQLRFPDFQAQFGKNENRRILIGVPRNANQSHMTYIREIIEQGLRAEPCLVWENIAAGIGAQLPNGDRIPIRSPESTIIADIGGGTMDLAVINNGMIVAPMSFTNAGDNIDEAIRLYLAKAHRIDVGYRTAISVKEQIGTAMSYGEIDDNEQHCVRGSSFASETIGMAMITAAEIRENCIAPVLANIAADFRKYLKYLQTYSEIHSDIQKNGFYLTGGTSLLKGLDQYLEKNVGIQVRQVDNPTTTVIDGLIQMIAYPELLQLGIAV